MSGKQTEGGDRPVTIAAILVGLVALEHVYFLIMEMFLWTSPGIRKSFGTSASFARDSRPLAANQGLYNGFLAAGLVWGMLHPNASTGYEIQTFFLVCVLIAAIFGGLTVKKSILYAQGIPAVAAWLAVMIAW
jgi:putative membrane protein